MKASTELKSVRRGIFFGVTFAIIVGLAIIPLMNSKAIDDPAVKTRLDQNHLSNYDIRTDKSAAEKISSFRNLTEKSDADLVGIRSAMVDGEKSLKRRVPTLNVAYNLDLRSPEVIAPDVKQGRAFLTKASSLNRADILKNFLKTNSDLVGARPSQVDGLKVFSDYANPDGVLSFVELNQEINGIPVFRGEVKAGFAPSGEIIRVINNLAPGLDDASLSTDFGNPALAVRAAAGHLNISLTTLALTENKQVSTDLKVFFGSGDSAPTAEKMYFPTEPGVAIPAWRVLIWQPVNSYYVIVDAGSGILLWRKSITEDQTQSATYNVYANPAAMANIADSPFPMTPGPSAPNGAQGSAISRTLVTRIGNEAPYSFNNLGWITDGNNTTDGNNVQAGLDREAPNLGNLDPNAIDPNSVPVGSPNRVFNFPFNPSIPTNPALNVGESPLPVGQTPDGCLEEGTGATPTDFQKAATTQLFYISNVFHDELYRLGFTEPARNFQNDNFGRGGLGGDRVSAQAQDCSGVNNANFSTPADGNRSQMQMYLWPGPMPDIDGSLDADVVIHELTHGTSNRLHGNSTGLVLDIARGMGEGWSDFYAHCLLSEPTDPLDGIYTLGAYDTYLFGPVGFSNYYYGIRRFPKAIKSKVGGPLNRPHNPLTFADIDATKIDLSDGAFSPRFEGTADQVHAIGEVWSIALWEIRARMIQRLGWEVGNRRVLQFVTDGMKLAPLGPTPLSERDSIIAGVFASGTEADLADVWAGFALRGIGASASIEEVGGTSIGSGLGAVRVTEAFDLPNIVQTPAIDVSDSTGDNDGYPEPGETVRISIPLKNSTGRTATTVAVQVVGGGIANYGSMPGNSIATQSATYTIPTNAACGSTVSVDLTVSSSLGPATFTRQIFVGRPTGIVATTENFDGVTAPSIPAGWTAVSISDGINFENSTVTPDGAPNAMYARDPTTVGGGTDLTSPLVSVTGANPTLEFRHSYLTERNWDGGVLEISVAGAPFQDILAAGGTFSQNGYNGALGAGRNSPLSNRAAWNGNSNGYVTTIVQFPVNSVGKIAQLRWRFGADDNTAVAGQPNPGWRIDNVLLTGAGFVNSFVCALDAQMVSISGRVLTPDGRALRNALISLTDAQGSVRRATSSSFGFFQFENVRTAQTYTVSASSRRFRFAPQIFNLTGAVTNLDLLGLE